jgi:hypothetical protein
VTTVVEITVAVLVPLTLGFIFPTRARPIALAGAVFGFGYWSFVLLSVLLSEPSSSSSGSDGEWSLGNYAFFYGVLVAAFLILWLLVAWAGRRLRVTANERRKGEIDTT